MFRYRVVLVCVAVFAASLPVQVYICDANNHRIRKVTTDGIVTTIAGG